MKLHMMIFLLLAMMVSPFLCSGQEVNDSDVQRLSFSEYRVACENVPDTTDGGLPLTLENSVIMALENNISFQVERLEPAISRTEIQIEAAEFEPDLTGRLYGTVEKDDSNLNSHENSEYIDGEVRVSKFYPTGTLMSAGVGAGLASIEDGAHSRLRDVNWDVTLVQSLLRGRGREVNLVRLKQAEVDARITDFQLEGIAEDLVQRVEEAYWDFILADRSVDIFVKSLEVADQQIREVSERIQVGKVAESDIVAAQAELARRREQLIVARGQLAKRRLELLYLLNPACTEGFWQQQLNLIDSPALPDIMLANVDEYVGAGLVHRADLSQARLLIDRGDLEVVRTKNGLLPVLDLFVSLGGTRYADSFNTRADEDGDSYALTVGVDFNVPLGNRNAIARHRRSLLTLEQAQASLQNMEQLVQVDIRSAYIDVQSTGEQVKATQATRVLREETLRVEEERARVGKSTLFQVAQAQRDLVESQISEVEAIIEYHKALLALCRLQGLLLERWGIIL